MFSNPDFAFPARKNIPAPLQQDVKSSRRSSAHSRQISVSSLQSSPSSPVRSSRPASGHHRRQSSVSSRRESHEIMGISVPNDVNDENQGGDSRQRALWALEGNKSAASGHASALLGFNKVEIPDWKTPEVEQQEYARSSSPFSISNG